MKIEDVWFEYVGNLHIHSIHSDGAGTAGEIAAAARQRGLDFIIFNDHAHMMDRLPLEEEGFYRDVLVLVGLEIGQRYNHYLAFDLKEVVGSGIAGPQEVVDQVNAQGGFGFLAHPFEKGMPLTEKSLAYTWKDFSVKDFAGICIWNFSSRWKEMIKSPLHGFFYLVFKTSSLKGPSRRTLACWDGLSRKRRVAVIGGSDAHGTYFSWGKIRLRPLSYAYLLNSVNVHILLDHELCKDLNKAKLEIYSALRQGRAYVAHENLAPARGFRFQFFSKEGPALNMGQEAPFRSGSLHVRTPKRSEIRLLRNGRLAKKWRGRRASYQVTKKGVYRVEVYHHRPLFGWRPWIFSNPIYLR
jgi:hypothetical protein